MLEYLQELFQFTLTSFNVTIKKPSLLAHANKLCLVWQRIILEAHLQQCPCSEQLELLVP
jgi:hypothetical protein